MAADSVQRALAENLVHRGVGGAELFDFTPERFKDLPSLRQELAQEGRSRLSFHVPVVRPDWFPWSGITCFFLCEDAERRALSFRLLDHTLELAARHGAERAVCHLTYGGADCKDPAVAEDLASDSLARMAAASWRFGVALDLEFAAYSDGFHDPARFVELLDPHAELGVCIDIGHTFLGAQKRGRDYFADLATLAPRARSLHLWNTKDAEHNRVHGHVPLHPSQTAAEGWIDVPKSLALVLKECPGAEIIYEYPIEALTADIQAGYDWIVGLIKPTTNHRDALP
jgi:sugar phosphate isomerase/epimerase